MNNKKILEEFKKFNIPEEELLEYTDPYTFARKIEKCSILQYDKVTYSGGTTSIEEKASA